MPIQSSSRMCVEDLQARKLRALEMHAEGLPLGQIIERAGLSRNTVKKVISAGVVPTQKVRGRKPGTGAAFTPEQELFLRIKMRQHPHQAEIASWVWTRNAVSALMGGQGKRLSRRAVDKYLVSWKIPAGQGNVPPSKRGTAKVQLWWSEHGADVAKVASEQGSEVLWLNRSIQLAAGDWHEPTAKPRSKYVQLLSATNMKGTLHWRIFGGSGSPKDEVQFLGNLKKYHAGQRLILIRSAGTIYCHPEVLAYVATPLGGLLLLPEAAPSGQSGQSVVEK